MSVNIPASGEEKCDILIVSDFPSDQDDFAGEGYQGAVGKLLRGMIDDAGLRDFRIAYTHAIRCKPKYGIKPLPSEIDACRNHLKDDIRERRPQTIIAMGDTALRALTKLSGVKDKRGKELPLHNVFNELQGVPGVPVYATYSASFVRRAPQLRPTVVSDLRRLGDFLGKRSGDVPTIPWSYWEEDSVLPDSPFYAWDLESVDYDGTYTDYPTLISVSGDGFTFVSHDNEASVRSLFEAMLAKAEAGSEFITHNGWAFDVPMMKRFGYENTPLALDTLVLAYFVDEIQPLGLEALAVKYLQAPGWKEAFTSKLGSEEFSYYAARDTHYTLLLHKVLSDHLGNRKTLVRDLILPARVAFDAMSERGVYIDKEAVLKEKEVAEHALQEARAKIAEITKSKDFNPGSSKQVGKYLTKLGFILPKTAGGDPSTSASVLQSFTGDTFIDALQTYRDHKKTLSTYVLPYLKIANTGDGRAHSTYSLVRTRTGRTNSKSPNVQNLTRELKHFFSAPPGKILVSVDYSAFQFRIAAWFANERTIIDRFADDVSWDAHKYFAGQLYDRPEEQIGKKSNERQIAKTANFSQLFMGTEITLYQQSKKNNMDMDLQECWEVHQAWHRAFPGFYTFYGKVADEIRSTGMVKCPTGHIRHFGDPKLFTDQTFGEALREGVNVLIQNMEAYMAFLAIRKLHEMGLPLVLFIHDSISFELCKDEQLDTTIQTICDIMTQYPIQALKEELGIDFTVPLEVEVSRSDEKETNVNA